MAAINYKILKEILVLPEADPEKETAFHVEVNIIDWNGTGPKLDIRRWSRYREKCGKGASLFMDDAKKILEAAEEIKEAVHEYEDK